MKKSKKNIKNIEIIFYTLLTVFVLLLLYFVVPTEVSTKRALFPAAAVLVIAFFIFGILLTVFVFKSKIKGKLKIYLLLTGFSAIGFLVFVLLHNFIYGFFIYLFGENFWRGGDEAFFLILAVIVCPILFLVGVVGSLVLLLKK
ncbi:hypothetical protein GF386_00245 [Candidatus Pacearchaeota archaeon]|nr:hypothetical protein [Candidatus Pacearchaeota archaeon]MBD3282712.1 hypothetical protein [Candidatus Pacearchaeota archaeon]